VMNRTAKDGISKSKTCKDDNTPVYFTKSESSTREATIHPKLA